MQAITDSPEHHFLTALEKCKVGKSQWVCLHFGLSRQLKHDAIVENVSRLDSILSSLMRKSRSFFDLVVQQGDKFANAYAYRFEDGDVVMLIHTESDMSKNKARQFFNTLSQKVENAFCDYGALESNFGKYMQLADQKLLNARKLSAYRAMADKNKVESISPRRKRRADPLVLVVEDDRFTAAYTTTIMNKIYEVIHVKTGEEAIIQYIDKAPDLILLDIHLPGLDGHKTLKAIQAIDPHSFAVILSADTSQDNVLTATRSGAETFLKKPFSKDRLLTVIRKCPHIRLRENRVRETVKI